MVWIDLCTNLPIQRYSVLCFGICVPSLFSPSPLCSANFKTKQAQNLRYHKYLDGCHPKSADHLNHLTRFARLSRTSADIWRTPPSPAVGKDLRGIGSKLAPESCKFLRLYRILDGISTFKNVPTTRPTAPLHLSFSPPPLRDAAALYVYLYCTDGILKQD